MRPLWIALLAVAVVTTAVVAVAGFGEPELVPVGQAPGEVTIVGDLTLDQAGAVPDVVTAHATISADRAVVLPALVVRVRDEAGRDHDFPRREDVALGATPTEITFRREFAERGDYTYSLAYESGGEWVDLPPWQSVTIR